MRELFSDVKKLTMFLLRRERVTSVIWIFALAGFSAILAAGISTMFDDNARQALVETMNNPAMIAMIGPLYGAENYTPGAMYSTMLLLWVAITTGVMNIFLIVRHTRADEEQGRLEVIRSLPVGRLSNLTSALATALIVNAVMGLTHAFGIYLCAGEPTITLSGSILYGAAVFVIGMVFAGVAALFSQLSQSSSGAVGYSLLALGLFYMLRAAGDAGSEILSIISPLGLILRTQIYIENYWWPIFLLLFFAVVIIAAAYALNIRRDIDQGFIAARPGKKHASKYLRTPFGLSLRLTRGVLTVFFIVMFSLGASYGSVFADIETFVSQSEFYQMIMGVNGDNNVPEMFVSMVTAIMSLIAAVPVLIIALKPLSEETRRRSEHVLSRGVSRIKYIINYAAISFMAAVVMQFATAAGLYVAIAAVIETPVSFGFLIKSNFLYIPALWILTGAAVLIIAALPRASGALWGFYGFSFFAAFVGRMLTIPKWITDITPFNHIPQLPADEINLPSLAVLVIIAAALTAAGVIFYGRRDMHTA